MRFFGWSSGSSNAGTIRSNNVNEPGMKMRGLSKTATLTLSIVSLIALSTGCRTVTVIPADRTISRMEAGHEFTPPVNGWFVPDARMLELMNALHDK